MKTKVIALIVAVLPTLAGAAQVEPWVPMGISSPLFESHPAFDPRTGDFYFVRSAKDFSGWRVLYSHCEPQGWSMPLPAPFAGDGVEADPYFTADGTTVYFISTRTTDGIKRKDLDIWRVDRDKAGHWGTPQRLPEPVNSHGAEWFPRPAADGWLYFGSKRAGGFGGNDIWRAHEDAPGQWRAENLGAAINTTADEYEPLPSTDAHYLVIMANDGLYESRLGDRGWSAKRKLDADINVTGSEIGALFSPSGKSLLFARDTKEPLSGEFFVWRIQNSKEAWPPQCPRKR